MKFELPKLGKEAIDLPHFPTRECAFVFRALEFFSYDKIAEILETEPGNIKELGAAMGIYQDQQSDVWLKKGYITIIRSMWQLLPYEQLLQLLGTDAGELAILLREEDFLDVKLSAKPVCGRLKWRDLSEEERGGLNRIKVSMDSLSLEGKEPFAFEYIMPDVELSGKENFGTRMIYLFSGLYQKCLDVDSEEYCPDTLLESYSRIGVNAIYMQGVLYMLSEFPFNKELSKGYEKRLDNLKRFTERCARYGIKIFLYLNEPRSMNKAFFEKYPKIMGHVKDDDHICMCTSTEAVQSYIKDAMETICKSAPLIGGFVCMAKSENLTNCYSHVHSNGMCNCPRCKEKSIGEVIGGFFKAVREGVDRVNPDIKIFDFSWDCDDLETRYDVIDHLPERIGVESICEAGVPYEIAGVKSKLNDYSLNIIGPGERALKMWKRAKERGLETVAKVQINTTWECSTVPALPVLGKVDQFMSRLLDEGVDHLQLSWTLGGYPSMNLLYACRYFFENAKIPALSEKMKKATKLFSDAFCEFPSGLSTAYMGPQNAGPATLFYEKPTGYDATMTCFAYDDLLHWRGKYSEDAFQSQLEKLCVKWKEGLKLIEDDENEEIRLMAEAGYSLFRSSLNLVRYVRLRDHNGTNKELYDVVLDEKENAMEMLKLMNQNPAIGFEAANHYYFSRFGICEKVVNCDYLLEKYSAKLKVGLIGCGGMGAFHAECWLRMKDEVELVAIADMNTEKAGQYAKRSNARIYTDGRKLLEQEELDVVDICLPTFLHAEYALEAMKKVRNIIIEKPVCLTEEQAQLLLEEQKKTGAMIYVAHCTRFGNAYKYVKEVVRSGKYGKVISGRFSRFSPRPIWMKGHDEKDRTGTMALDMHIHDADYIRYLMEREPEEVRTNVVKDKNGIIQHIYSAYCFEGALLVAEASWDYPIKMPFCASFRLRLEKAAIILDDHGILRVYPEDGEEFIPDFPPDIVADLGINVSNLTVYLNELCSFVKNIKDPSLGEAVSLADAVASFRLVCREMEMAEG